MDGYEPWEVLPNVDVPVEGLDLFNVVTIPFAAGATLTAALTTAHLMAAIATQYVLDQLPPVPPEH